MANAIIDNSEDRIGMEAAGRVAGVHKETAARWCFRGVNTPTGRVYLEFVKVGAKLFTSAPAVARFVAACTEANTGNRVTDQPTPAARQRAAEGAARAMELAGA